MVRSCALAIALIIGPTIAASDENSRTSRRAAPPVTAESAAAVREEFLQVCRALGASDNAFYGTKQVSELETQLAQPVEHPLPRAVLRARLALELLRLGDAPRAVELLEEALKIAEAAELERDLRLDILRSLGLARLRLGEQRNCVAGHGPASCILPLVKEGIHRDPRGALGAMESYEKYLAEKPDDAVVAWLFNVAAMTAGRYPAAVPQRWRLPANALRTDGLPAERRLERFDEVATEVGVVVVQSSGAGLVDDFDGDGLLDLVTTTINPCRSMTLHRNDGRGGFEDRTAAARLDSQLGGLNAVHADYDNDGDNDLLVLRGGWFGEDGRMRKSLLRNDGDGTFSDVTRAAGLAEPAYPTQAADWADYDGDGDLDLYVGSEADDEGKAYPSQLFRNQGDGTFTEIAASAGVENRRMAKGVAWGDYDNDGDPDLYVSNIGPNRLYRNSGDGTFVDVATELGVTEPSRRSFATWFFDYDNDGWLDVFVADYDAPLELVAQGLLGRETSGGHPLLYRNLEGRGFREMSRELGLTAPCLPMGANFGDLDNDGFLDFYLGTGTPSYESIMPNLMVRNDGGRRFVDVTYSGGFGHLQKGHGVAFGDLDRDGDQDVFEQMGGAYPGDAYPSVVYRNPGHGRSWVTLRLIGVQSNRSAIGARLRLLVRGSEGERTIHAVVDTGGSFGGSSLQQEIGLGEASSIAAVEIWWPTTGVRQRFTEVAARRHYELREDEDRLRELPVKPFTLGSQAKPTD